MTWIQITYDNASNNIGHIDHSEKLQYHEWNED